MKEKFKKNWLFFIPIVIGTLCLLLYGKTIYDNSYFHEQDSSVATQAYQQDTQTASGTETETVTEPEASSNVSELLKENTDIVSFRLDILDVGNALCVILESNGEYLIYDGGDRETSSYVVSYLNDRGISSFKYLVASHYHADHVYGLIGVLENFDVEEILTPDYVSATGAYKTFLKYAPLEEHHHPYEGEQFQVGNVTLRTICPCDDAYSDDNGYSIGFVGTYGNFRFLIDGDATDESEKDMLIMEEDVSADLLIVPHHGSSYSSTEEWLRKVSPKVSVISCGANNPYYHPHGTVLNRLREVGSELYRTDLNGSIQITSDGKTFSVITERTADEEELWQQGKGPENGDGVTSSVFVSSSDEEEEMYIGNIASKKFHRPTCELLPKESRQVIFYSRDDAIVDGYLPCGACEP